jgi:cell division initiation protein
MKKFSKEFNGYNKEEVNAFLTETIGQTEKILSKLERQQSEISSLKAQIVHYQDIERSLNLALNNAHEVGEDIRKMAKNEARSIVDEAHRNANRIVNDALIRSEKIELKTENAERNLRILKKKLRNIIEQQLDIVSEIETLEVEE